MKEIYRCYLCSSEDYEVLIAQKVKDPYYQLISADAAEITMTWVKCKKCGFTYRIQQLLPDEIAVLYKRYRNILMAKETPDQYFDRITSLSDDESENMLRAKAFGRIIKDFIKTDTKNHLDIGTGAGVFIHSFQRCNTGWNSFAFEVTPVFAETARKKLGIEVYEGFYRPSAFNKKFQLITILQVLEHIYDPRNTLRDITLDLDREGVLIIEVPSASNIGLLLPHHDMFSIPHFCLYSIDTLQKLLQKSGFEVLVAEEIKLLKRNTVQVRVAASYIG